MVNTAVVFPGQGSQFVGMGRELIESSVKAKERVEEANDIVGFNIGKLMLEGPESELNLTSNTQPSMLLISVMIYEEIQAQFDFTPVALAGHSLGEFSACWAAGAIGFSDAIKLVKKRGEFMQSAVPVGEGIMAAIIGLDADAVTAMCDSIEGVVEPANFNSPEQVVIGGRVAAVKQAMKVASDKGAKKVVSLSVSAPFHTSLMEPAGVKLARELENISLTDPNIPVVRNIDAKVNKTSKDVRNALTKQVTGCVLWVDCIKKLKEFDVSLAFEVGAGRVLTGLMRRIDRALKTIPIHSVIDINKAVEELNGQTRR